MRNLSLHFELHIPFEHNDNFIRRMREIFPALARRIGPQFATEAAGFSVGGDLVGVGGHKFLAER